MEKHNDNQINQILMNNSYNLSELDIKILKYLSKLDNEDKLFLVRIEEISKYMKVSNSKITKTLQKCGFSGFKDFRAAAIIVKGKKVKDNKVISYLENTLIYSLSQTFENISRYDFNKFNKFVNESNEIYFMSGGLNNNIGNIFATKFNKIGKKARSIEISNPECNNIVDNSLIIVISLSGKNYKILNRIKYIKENNKNVKIMSITISNRTNIFEYCDKEYSLSFVDYENLNERELPRQSFSIIIIFLDMFFLEYYKTEKEKFDKIIALNADYIK